ncbi:MAG: N-6 DNA methylase [Planctomycetes bacterium]|nr:N-6 DNA methylase [Planctomycetota bacterium]
MNPATGPQRCHDRWARARHAIRRLVARRLSPRLALQLLPLAHGEPGEPGEGDEVDPGTGPEAAADGSFAALAAHYPTLLAADQRKQRGTWYTPAALVEPTVERTLAPLLRRRDPATLRICDPAVGGGTFLIAALRCLQRSGLDTRRAALGLHGVDIDSTAAALAALAVHEACGADSPGVLAIAGNIRHGDGLIDQRDGSFDAVLTNPPWETLQATAEARDRIATLRPRFVHQGSGKLYTYRLFVERGHQLLRDGGRFGLIVPASLWFDRDAAALRRLLLERCEWEWMFGFENRKRLFDIDGRYRFAVITGGKGGRTASVKVAFGRTDPDDWAAASPRHVAYPAGLLSLLSPRHRTFVEVEHPRDLAILERIVRHGRPLVGPDGAFGWRQGDFNMTADRHHFVLRSEAEANGFVRGEDAVWRRDAEAMLPLYQGAMVYDLHPNTGAHRHGTGHATTWERPRRDDELRPQYLVSAEPWLAAGRDRPAARVVLRALSNATNERTAVTCLLPDVPCGNSLGVLTPRAATAQPLLAMAAGAAALGSLPFDWALRRRLTGTNLNGFVLADCVLPILDDDTATALARLCLQLCAVLPWHGGLWRQAAIEGWADDSHRAAVGGDRRRSLLVELDTIVGRAFGLDGEDVGWIVGDAGRRGFSRVDRELPAEQRRPHRWLSRAVDG